MHGSIQHVTTPPGGGAPWCQHSIAHECPDFMKKFTCPKAKFQVADSK